MEFIGILISCSAILCLYYLITCIREIVVWNHGKCRQLKSKWKEHSRYADGRILYVANQHFLVIRHHRLIATTDEQQVLLVQLLSGFCTMCGLSAVASVYAMTHGQGIKGYAISALLLFPALLIFLQNKRMEKRQ